MEFAKLIIIAWFSKPKLVVLSDATCACSCVAKPRAKTKLTNASRPETEQGLAARLWLCAQI
jgi:hypothetical protein